MAKYPTYTVAWSEEDGEFVATCDWMPSMSWLDDDPREALNGLIDELNQDDDAVAAAGMEFNRRRADNGVSEETIVRMAVTPGRWLRDLRTTAKQSMARARRNIELAEKVLAEKSGHGPSGQYGLSCLCGWYSQGGYPMDKQRAVWAHVEEEWAKVQ